jgi:hypothetical protein
MHAAVFLPFYLAKGISNFYPATIKQHLFFVLIDTVDK